MSHHVESTKRCRLLSKDHKEWQLLQNPNKQQFRRKCNERAETHGNKRDKEMGIVTSKE